MEHAKNYDAGARGQPAELTSVQFAQVARDLSEMARHEGLIAPIFRSPPRNPSMRRSIHRRADGSATVSVARRGRPAVAVIADMIDGIQAANAPAHRQAKGKYHLNKELYDCLWSAAAGFLAGSVESRTSDRQPVDRLAA